MQLALYVDPLVLYAHCPDFLYFNSLYLISWCLNAVLHFDVARSDVVYVYLALDLVMLQKQPLSLQA